MRILRFYHYSCIGQNKLQSFHRFRAGLGIMEFNATFNNISGISCYLEYSFAYKAKVVRHIRIQNYITVSSDKWIYE